MSNTNTLDVDIVRLRQSASYREEVCKYLYKNQQLKDLIFHFINKLSCYLEPKEVLQEAIVRFFHQAMDVDFRLEGKAEHYIFGIAKNIVYVQLKTSVSRDVVIEELSDNLEEPIETSKDIVAIIGNVLKYTTDTCRKVLMYWAHKHTMDEIAMMMGYKSKMMARKKKYECLKNLCEYLDNNPALKASILEDVR